MKKKYLILASSRNCLAEAGHGVNRKEVFENLKDFLKKEKIEIQTPKVLISSKNCRRVKILMELQLDARRMNRVGVKKTKTLESFNFANQIASRFKRNNAIIGIYHGSLPDLLWNLEVDFEKNKTLAHEQIHLIDFNEKKVIFTSKPIRATVAA